MNRWLFPQIYDRQTQDWLMKELTRLSLRMIRRTEVRMVSSGEIAGVGIETCPTGQYCDGEQVFLLTHSAFERGDPAPGGVMIFAGPRAFIEERAGKLWANLRPYLNEADENLRN